jgi:hypothetical protein
LDWAIHFQQALERIRQSRLFYLSELVGLLPSATNAEWEKVSCCRLESVCFVSVVSTLYKDGSENKIRRKLSEKAGNTIARRHPFSLFLGVNRRSSAES